MIKTNIPNYDLSSSSTSIVFDRIEDRRDDLVNNPHRHEFYEILWFKNDGGEHIVDFHSFGVKKDMIFFLAPGMVHQMDLTDKDGYLIAFSQNIISKIIFPQEDTFFNLFYSYNNNPYILPLKDDLYKLNILCELIYLEYKKNALNNTTILQTHLRAFLLYSLRIKEQKEELFPNKNYERIIQLFQLIETYFKTERSTDFYSNHLALTSKRINEIAKERVGKTISGLLEERLLLEAKRELFFGKKSIKEIAYLLGFKDPAYFSRYFKKQTDISPEQFKIKMFK